MKAFFERVDLAAHRQQVQQLAEHPPPCPSTPLPNRPVALLLPLALALRMRLLHQLPRLERTIDGDALVQVAKPGHLSQCS